MSAKINVELLFQAVDNMSHSVDQMKKSLGGFEAQAEKTSQKTSMFKDALATASGVLIRDFVNNASKAVTSGMELAAQFQSLNSSFNAMKANLGATDLSLEKLQKAVKGTVAKTDLLAAANKAMSLGLPTDDLDNLFASAMKLGRVMGISTLNAVDSLTTGIGRQSQMILDNLGIVFRAEDAYSWYAGTLGKTVQELSESEKKLGWQAYAMEQVTVRAAALGDIEDDMITKQEQMSASMKDLNTEVGNALGPLGQFKEVFELASPILNAVALTIIPALIGKIGELKVGTTTLTASFNALTVSATAAWSAVAGLVGLGAYVSFETGKTKTQKEILGPSGVKAPSTNIFGQPVSPLIPWKQEGGVFNKPSIIGVGEAGPEAVIPLDQGGFGGLTINQYFTVDSWTDLNKVREAAAEGANMGVAEKLRRRGR